MKAVDVPVVLSKYIRHISQKKKDWHGWLDTNQLTKDQMMVKNKVLVGGISEISLV